MTQQHTNDVQGQRVEHADDLVDKPGAFSFEATDRGLFYTCPCGCQREGFLGFRGRVTPERPSWEWDGNRDQPTLSPSIRQLAGCKWHGYLVAGVWKPQPDSGK